MLVYVDVGVLGGCHLDISVLFNDNIGILPRFYLKLLMVYYCLMTAARTL